MWFLYTCKQLQCLHSRMYQHWKKKIRSDSKSVSQHTSVHFPTKAACLIHVNILHNIRVTTVHISIATLKRYQPSSLVVWSGWAIRSHVSAQLWQCSWLVVRGPNTEPPTQCSEWSRYTWHLIAIKIDASYGLTLKTVPTKSKARLLCSTTLSS